ncbi:MATE family efflux transporter [Humisphaera borealis]|uniref:MATE family efflux transporter n=1 Tax=Humisphaera borealis TaxID=2807512 RepID=A0A7M2WS32_9BACT|nr:MATE family efflux transporter [Humisphaera borealis]
MDVASGYLLALFRILSWAGVTAFLYREAGPVAFGIFALLRGTISILSYTSLGLGPALVHAIAKANARDAIPAEPLSADTTVAPPGIVALGYANTAAEPVPAGNHEQAVITTGLHVARLLTAFAFAGAIGMALATESYFASREVNAGWILLATLALGCGVATRIAGEPASAILQVRGLLALDNFILAGAEVCWLLVVVLIPLRQIDSVAGAWALCCLGTTVTRVVAVTRLVPDFETGGPKDPAIMRSLLRFGGGITLAQTADFLYAPCSYLIIQSLLGPSEVATYAPLVQIDSALLLVVAGIAGAVFPRAARSFAAGNLRELRHLYVRGTLTSLALLIAAGIATMLLGAFALRLWLGDVSPQTLMLLPLLLVHTVIGGASGVGRAVLLGMGRVRVFMKSSLIAGSANVVLGATLAGPVGWGLKGIVLATIIVVVARCAIWMPWYVLKMTNDENRLTNQAQNPKD